MKRVRCLRIDTPPLRPGPFDLILADPAMQLGAGSAKGQGRQPLSVHQSCGHLPDAVAGLAAKERCQSGTDAASGQGPGLCRRPSRPDVNQAPEGRKADDPERRQHPQGWRNTMARQAQQGIAACRPRCPAGLHHRRRRTASPDVFGRREHSRKPDEGLYGAGAALWRGSPPRAVSPEASAMGGRQWGMNCQGHPEVELELRSAVR